VKPLLRKIFLLILGMYFLMVAALVFWQVAVDLGKHPLNPRRYGAFRQPRGAILDRSGLPLARTLMAGEKYVREYADPSVTHVTGYFHQRYGITGLEKAFDARLQAGQDVYTTIDLRLQQKVAELMGDRVGAAVVMEPETGAVLALVSCPQIDGNSLDDFWSDYLADQRSPFVNRAVQGLYPPGSALKPLVLAAALAGGITTADAHWTDRGVLKLGEEAISNHQGQAWGVITTSEALAHSSNVVFAQLAVELGPALLDALRRFGLGEAVLFPLSQSSGRLPSAAQSAYGWAQIGIGQGGLLATPLQMAAAISAIANGGKLMRPYLVQEIKGGWRLRQAQRPEFVRQAVPQWAAADVRDAMVLAVEKGTARAAAVRGTVVAGKTGTAQTGSGGDHSWFVGFAPAEKPELAVVVVLEHGGLASQTAAPLGGQILREALQLLAPQDM